MSDIEILEDMSCKRIDINGTEYLRIEGVWFEYTNDYYIPIDNEEFETLYQEKFLK